MSLCVRFVRVYIVFVLVCLCVLHAHRVWRYIKRCLLINAHQQGYFAKDLSKVKKTRHTLQITKKSVRRLSFTFWLLFLNLFLPFIFFIPFSIERSRLLISIASHKTIHISNVFDFPPLSLWMLFSITCFTYILSIPLCTGWKFLLSYFTYTLYYIQWILRLQKHAQQLTSLNMNFS